MIASRAPWGRPRIWLKGIVFLCTGAALIATSAPVTHHTMYGKVVPEFETTLNNQIRTVYVTFDVVAQEASHNEQLIEEADLTISLSAEHDAAASTYQDPPWLWFRVVPEPFRYDATAGSPATGEELDDVPGAFLTGGSRTHKLTLNKFGRASVTWELKRSSTATEFDTRVSWQPTLKKKVPAEQDEERELPWNVEVIHTPQL